ncbi:Leucine-rich repeat, cysteine-containing subtype [Corchorus olitorius]|uniref:Leucine-rich repeat, cysteine-containing subtype n=1 Tax=Corchorus olitorius TaxID=93759 RepID=A0A1R3HGB9_9ROSI|nr:Leucine-rich repeat, cysteine-containing subtype [Corchorus olitorius]
MDEILCDELVQEIFRRLPSSSPSSSLSVSLVSKRWLNLYRSSKASLSLKFLPHDTSMIVPLSSLLSNYPSLSSLSLVLSDSTSKSTTSLFDHLLSVVASYCSNLNHLKFLTGPVSVPSLLSLSKSCSHLTSITISLPRPLSLTWVVSFSCLKDLSLHVCSIDQTDDHDDEVRRFRLCSNEELDEEFGLENLCLSGIQTDDKGVGWLWRNCKRLKKLQLKSCQSVGDAESFSSFISTLKGLEEVELRKCRSIVDGVLLKLAQNCSSLISLLVYDGGSKEGLLEFITTSTCNLQKLDLRLPLDLSNDHLLAVALNQRNLSTLRLQSCFLVTGEGLKALGIALGSTLEELALIKCDVVEREIGLLATLGQNLRMLRKLNLSYNEMLFDKEFVSMLVSCNNLTELKLRGCRTLTAMALVSISKTCKLLESVDIMNCPGIEAQAVEFLVLNCPKLRQVQVEDGKVSDIARKWALHKAIEVIDG